MVFPLRIPVGLIGALAAGALSACSAAKAGDATAAKPQPVSAPSVQQDVTFRSLRFAKSFVRRGPSMEQPEVAAYQRKGLPVETLGRSGSFYLIRDPGGQKGWIHHSQLSRKRTVMVRARPAKAGPLPLMARPDAKGRPRALLEPGVVAELVACEGAWRRIEVGRTAGWAPAKALYAADPCPAPN